MFAAAAVANTATRRTAALTFLALALPLNLPTREASTSYAAELEFYRGLAYVRYQHDPRGAVDHFRRATKQGPTDERFWFELGNALDASHLGDPVDAWRHAATLDPWDSRARRRIATALTQRGDLDGAIDTLEANIATHARDDAHYAPDHLNLAFLYVKRGAAGDGDRAAEHFMTAAFADPGYFRSHVDAFLRSVREVPGVEDSVTFAAFKAIADQRRGPLPGEKPQ
jgi:tetratricopeptide (TPR) repeat protein